LDKNKSPLNVRSHPTISWNRMTYKPSTLGHTDRVFGFWSQFISRPAHAWLQKSPRVCSGYDL